MFDLTTIFHGLPRPLFPALAEELGEPSALDQQFWEFISLTQLGRFTGSYEWCGAGRSPCVRAYQFPTTGALIGTLADQPACRDF
jgi:hypothetical protein